MTSEPIPLRRPVVDHRQLRPSRHVERHGADTLADDELLEIILGGGASARRSARRLLDRFGSLVATCLADPVELRIAGVGEAASVRPAAALEIGRRVARARLLDATLVRTPADAAERLVDVMAPLAREELRVLLLDTKNVIVAERVVYRGTLAGSSVRVGEVYRDAVRRGAAAIIVAHNHPSGDPSPSGEDLRITAELAEAGRLLDIELLDHLVIGRGRWTSLRAIGAIAQSPSATMR